MHKQCHWSMASYLMGDGSWRLHGYALKIGSIMPDILVHTYWIGHKHDTTAKRVEANLNNLKDNGTWTLINCFRLGYNLHFLEDYFTHPHNSNFEGGFVDHCKYEFRLKKALKTRFAQEQTACAPAADCTSISSVLTEMHSEYMNTTPSPENDVNYIVAAAEVVSQELFSAFNAQARTRRSQAFMARAGVAG